MKCPEFEKLSQYVDQILLQEEMDNLADHLSVCSECRKIVNILREEEDFIKDTLKTPLLPEYFADEIIDQLDPIGQGKKKKRPIIKRWKQIFITAASVLIAIALTASFNESFAEWFGGLFTTDQVDEGLRLATDEGFVSRVNKKVTDQGLTFKVEDVVADMSRIALSYQILDQKGKLHDTNIHWDDSKNRIFAVDQNGNKLESFGTSWQQGSEYGLIELSLREYDPVEKVTIFIHLTELKGIEGNWHLEIDVDITDSLKNTTIVDLSNHHGSFYGVNIQMKEVRYVPSSYEILYETSFTEQTKKQITKTIKEFEQKFGTDAVSSFTNYGTALQYHVENKEKEVLYRHNTFVDEKGHPTDSGILQGIGMGMGQLGHIRWNESFIPAKEDDDLAFVLDGVVKVEPADFSITFKPKELNRHPITFEYEGNEMTIKKAKLDREFSLRKSFLPIEWEKVYKIEMEGVKTKEASELGAWVLTDNKGNPYFIFHSGSILDEKEANGRFKQTIELTSYELDEEPEELTLHLLSVTRFYKVEDQWKVPLHDK